ncbi:MAG: bifunctional precorrin-2 dehydrogenase/sirohydrochlorin ferrochelatase [Peptococcaceae bacterium]|nr:bifunctional precorrin-2 dehydrogenase/sirohydrochlorin ferrochelatase [Peptococcaceae bacterium]
MGFYPITLDLGGKSCLVVGGGAVAERKVGSLLACDALVRLVSPELTPVLRDLVADNKVSARFGCYTVSDLDGVVLVVCATDNREINRQVAADCTARNLPVNVVDQPELCSFLVPAVVRRGDLTIAVSTGGKSPLLARKIRESLEQSYGEQYGEFLDLLSRYRRGVLEKIPDEKKKRDILEQMVSAEIFALLEENRMDQVKERLDSAYHNGGA